MATKKQRRRRDKLQRHEYVWQDEEGNEIAPSELRRNEAKPREARARTARGRTVQPPSWSKTAKRGLIFAPIMLVTVMLVAGDEMSLGQQIFQTVFLLAVFLPFSYFMDAMLWRSYQKRAAKSDKSQ